MKSCSYECGWGVAHEGTEPEPRAIRSPRLVTRSIAQLQCPILALRRMIRVNSTQGPV